MRTDVSSELIYFIIGAVAANLILLGALLVLPRDEADDAATPGADQASHLPALREPTTKYERAAGPEADALRRSVHGPSITPPRVLRVLWWVTIAAVLIGVGVSGEFIANQALIYATGAVAVLAVIFFYEVLPGRWRRPFTYWIEALAALSLVSVLLMLTGYAESPFFFALIVVAVAVALVRGGRAALLVAALAAIAYVAVVAVDPALDALGPAELLRYALNIGSIWLLAFLAAFFSGQERRVRSAMLQLSVTDPLTGLFNRAQIYGELEQEIRRTRRSERGFCLLMIDLDGLKEVNDSFGHHRGDEVLAGLGAVIQRSIRAVDTAYRYGGDEFVVLLPETDIVGAYVVAEKIRTGAEDLAVARVEGAQTSVSIGLVSHPEDGATVDELMIAADRAMYAAKALGKNQISGYPRPRRTPPPLPAPPIASTPVGPGPQQEPAGEPQPIPATPGSATADPAQQTAEAPSILQPATDEPATSAEPPPSTEHRAEQATPGDHNGASEQRNESETDDFDPAEARRRIAALSYDPDHQIRRAMDAFLSAPPARERRDRPD